MIVLFRQNDSQVCKSLFVYAVSVEESGATSFPRTVTIFRDTRQLRKGSMVCCFVKIEYFSAKSWFHCCDVVLTYLI